LFVVVELFTAVVLVDVDEVVLVAGVVLVVVELDEVVFAVEVG